jgi:hypothetical protein
MRGMLTGQAQKQKLSGLGTCKYPPVINPSEDVFNEVGAKVMTLLETAGYDTASDFVFKNVRDSKISISQSHRLFDIMNTLVH